MPSIGRQVKLKYKMPFPIEVHSRRTENQPGGEEPAAKSAPEGEGVQLVAPDQQVEEAVQEHAPMVQGVAQSADGSQQFSFISLGEIG